MNKSEEIIEENIFEKNSNEITINNISEYLNKEGIWVLYGIKSDSKKWDCLNVGKSKNVGKEILYDLACLNFISYRDNGTKKYINQFGKDCKFKYKTGQVKEYLYPFINKNYKKIKFVYVSKASSLKKEKEYAKDIALFWRNGKPYKNVKQK